MFTLKSSLFSLCYFLKHDFVFLKCRTNFYMCVLFLEMFFQKISDSGCVDVGGLHRHSDF